jgi:hypothetical protein
MADQMSALASQFARSGDAVDPDEILEARRTEHTDDDTVTLF